MKNYRLLNDNSFFQINQLIIGILIEKNYKIDDIFIYNYIPEQNNSYQLYLFTKTMIDIQISIEDNEIHEFKAKEINKKQDFYNNYNRGTARKIINYYEKKFRRHIMDNLK